MSIANQEDNQIPTEEGQPQVLLETSNTSLPIPSSTPLESTSDFYNTPLTGQTPIYSGDSNSGLLNGEISAVQTPANPPDVIPGLSTSNEVEDKSAPIDMDTNSKAVGSVTEASDAARPDLVAPPVQATSVTDPMETDRNEVDLHMADSEEHPEWEVDSSPYESSSDSSTDSSDSDDSDEDDEDYPILSAEETARILMQAEGGSDDESENKAGSRSQLRTANEQIEEAPPIPEIKVTEDMKIVPLGYLESLVENIILIRATVSGDYQVLESNSLLCLEDRTVIGVVADTLGRVEEPLYTVRYQDPAKIQEFGLEKGKQIFYVESHSEFVFTQPLKGQKGSDASNFHDEEVGEDEIEFSDDEAEAEYKRRLKQKKKDRKDVRSTKPASGPSPLGQGELNYDDAGDRAVDDGYTPLTRPKNYHEMMTQQEVHTEAPTASSSSSRGNFRGRGRGRGGNDRGSGRGRGTERRGRGNPYGSQPQAHKHSPKNTHEDPATSQYQNYNAPTPALPPQQHTQYPGFPPFQQQPSQFPSFGQFQPTQISPFAFQVPYQQNAYQGMSAGAHINPTFFAALQQQLQQQQHQQQQHQQHQQPSQQPNAIPLTQNQVPANQSAFSQVQAQLDILRHLAGARNAHPPR